MSATAAIRVGNKGRIVVPVEIRANHGWDEGTVLIAVERPEGVLLMSREEALRSLRAQAKAHGHGGSVVDELIAERRAEAAREDADSM